MVRVGRAIGLAFVLLCFAGVAAASGETPRAPTETNPTSDFDGDGIDDLAVGAIWEDIGTVVNAGGVNVIYGTDGGLSSSGDQFWSQNSAGIVEISEMTDHFGQTLATGDFDGDGFDDLAVGAPGEGTGTFAGVGVVHVIYGSSSGLTSTGNQSWHQNSRGIPDVSEAGDAFGWALAAGDFGGDGYADLAVGVPNEATTVTNTGAVHVLNGSATGLTSTGNQFWTQDSTGILDASETDDSFGQSLAAGDFDTDGEADLAIGVPDEGIGTVAMAGAVNVLYGTPGTGLTSTGNQFWHQDVTDVLDAAEATDRFGYSLAAGNFTNDGTEDLAIGVPYEDPPRAPSDGGAVSVLYGTSGPGLAVTGNQFWTQNSTGILDTAEGADYFGWSLATGEFDDNQIAGVAIGVKSEDVGTVSGAGAVNVIYGTSTGLTSTGNQFWTQDSSGISDTAEASDEFGWSLSAGNWGEGFMHDLAVGVPAEAVGSVAGAGAVTLIYGSSSGLAEGGDQFWHQDVSGVEGSVEAQDRFGEDSGGGR